METPKDNRGAVDEVLKKPEGAPEEPDKADEGQLPLVDLDKLTNRQRGYLLLKNVVGIKQCEAGRMVGYSKAMTTFIEKKLPARYNITSKKFVKLAGSALERLLKAESFGEIKTVKDSTVLSACEMIYDRVLPKRSVIEMNERQIGDDNLSPALRALLEEVLHGRELPDSKTIDITPKEDANDTEKG